MICQFCGRKLVEPQRFGSRIVDRHLVPQVVPICRWDCRPPLGKVGTNLVTKVLPP